MNQIKIGAILSYISIIFTFAVGLIYTPILIRWLGQSDYGLYSIVMSFAAYLSLMDMGVGNAIVRYIARNKAIGNSKTESDLIGQFLKFFTFIGLLTVIIGTILCLKTPAIFNNSLEHSDVVSVQVMIAILTVNFAISFPLNVYSAVIQAYERFIFIKLMTIVRIITVPIITLIALSLGGKLIAMTIIISLVNISILLVNYYYARVKLGLKTSFAPIDREMKKEIILYSFFIFISAMADKLYWQTDQILLGILESSKVVAIYAVAIQLITIFASLSTGISNLFLPKLTILLSKNESQKQINNIFEVVSKYQYIIMMLCFSGFVLFGREFITIWAGESYTPAYTVVLIIMIPFIVDLIQNLALMIMQAKGTYHFRAILMIICAFVNLLISIPVIKHFGFYGTAVVTAIFVALGNVIVLNFYFHIKLHLNMWTYWKNIFYYTAPLIPLFLFSLYFKINITNIDSIIGLILYISVYACLYLIITWKFILTHSERRKIRGLFKRIN